MEEQKISLQMMIFFFPNVIFIFTSFLSLLEQDSVFGCMSDLDAFCSRNLHVTDSEARREDKKQEVPEIIGKILQWGSYYLTEN